MPEHKILLVDDEPRVLSALSRRLSLDFDVTAFENPVEALKYINSGADISVIVADMRMPEMSGLELLQASQKCRPKIKRIMLTGNSDQKTAIDAINQGNVYRFLRKPCDADVVKTAIRTAIEDTEFAASSIDALALQMDNQRAPKAEKMFLSVMSEELRTPLSQVITISDTLNDQGTVLNERAKARMLRQIGESGKKALAQVDRILTFVKFQTQSIEPAKFQEVPVSEILSAIVSDARSKAGERGVSVSAEIEEATSVLSINDNVRVALVEALSNAVKFNKSGGHVSIQMIANKDRAAIRITNSGNEFDKAVLNPGNPAFRDLNFGLNRDNYGMGLGLSLIKAAAAGGGFKCDLWPRPKGGASMTFVFDCGGTSPAL